MGEEPTEMRPDPADPEREPARPAPDDPAVIRAEMAQTRAEMAETIDALQEKLSPQNLVDQAKDTVRDATVGRIKTMVSSATETASGMAEEVQDRAYDAAEYVRENPLPAALIGAGVAWLVVRSRQRRDYRDYRDYREYRSDRERTPSYASTTEGSSTLEGAAAYAQSRPRPAMRYRSDRGDAGWLDVVRANAVPATLAGLGLTWLMNRGSGSGRSSYPRTSSTMRSTQQLGRQAQQAVGDAAETVQENWRYYSGRAESEFDRWMRENPLTVGVAALAIGAAVGLSAPRTETEDEWMGEARDTLVDRAQDLAQDTVQKAQQVVDTAQETVQQAQQAVGGPERARTASASAAPSSSRSESPSGSPSGSRPETPSGSRSGSASGSPSGSSSGSRSRT